MFFAKPRNSVALVYIRHLKCAVWPDVLSLPVRITARRKNIPSDIHASRQRVFVQAKIVVLELYGLRRRYLARRIDFKVVAYVPRGARRTINIHAKPVMVFICQVVRYIGKIERDDRHFKCVEG